MPSLVSSRDEELLDRHCVGLCCRGRSWVETFLRISLDTIIFPS